MPVEVERDQGEVSVKADIENATENKPEIVVPTSKEDVGNGISHGGNNGNGNDKEDSDGSYVFITENDAVVDDSAESVSLKPVDANVERDLKEGENLNSGELKVEATSSADDVLGVSQDSQTLEKSEIERTNDGPEEVDVGIPKSEIEDLLGKIEEKQHPGNGHLEIGHDGKLESTEKVEQSQDSEAGPGDLPKNNAENPANLQEKLEDKIESDVKTDVDVDASEDLQHNEDVAKHPVDSDESKEPEVVSAKVSPTDPINGGISLEEPTVTDPAHTVNGFVSVNDPTGTESESAAVLESVPVENGKVQEVSSDVSAETQALTAVSLESHTSGKDGGAENGHSKSESEAIQELDFVENSKVQSETGAVDASLSDEIMNTNQESQDVSELVCDQDGKQNIASEVTEVVDAPASEVVESSDAVVVANDSVSEDPIQNDQSDAVTEVKEKDAPIEKVEENNSEGNLNSGDVSLNSADEAKESPTGDHESAETLSTNTNGPSSLVDSKAAVSELAESSAEGEAGETSAVATKSEAATVKEITEHVVAPTTEDGEINREVNGGSEVNVTKTTPVDVSGDIPPEEVSEIEGSDIKERSAINTDEEVGSDTKTMDSTESPLVNNGIVKVGEEEDSREEKNETSSATASASVESETKSCAQDLESKVVTSTDTIHTGAKDCVDSQPAENKGGDAADRTDDKVAEIGGTEKLEASSVEGSALDASEGHTVVAEIEKRPFYFLPRVPRYDDEKLSEQLKHAEAQVEEKTQSRDALRADIQKIRATCKDYDISYKAAMTEERSARKAMHSKRQEIDALQSVISRVKSAASVDDIDLRMHNMEHMIQHETLSLSEEKGLIREIKQLKQLRAQISSSMGTKDEVNQALDDKEKTEESLKVLRKELDVLRSDLSKVEAITKAAKKKCDEEWEVQSKLQEKFRAADAVRQEAFAHLQDLKKQQREKNKYFFKYRDDSRAASEMALKKDRASLQSLCSDQVENFMNKWNSDDEFRSYYVRCNTRSTLRRFGTLDGRSLGPDEEPPRITYATRTDRLRTSSDRAAKLETAPPVSAQEEKVVKHEGTKVENNGKAVAKPAEQKSQSQTTKSKKTVKPDQPPPIVKELVSEKEEIEKKAETEEEGKQPKLTKEEEELIKKEEEKRKQKEAAKLKEQHRLEEIAKAKEAMERKKKREEKAKARAVLKAQKEAEEREKEREKKLRKKERRKGVITSDETTENPNEASETVVETPREIETPKKQATEESQQIKKSHKPLSQFLKQNKSKSIPLPLRNRGSKRKLRQWMWIGLVVLVVLALFLLGNANLSFSRAKLWFI
ncbi:unnamed protein product [Microthlaspi erraticum]|uniref:Proton pump-interactor 1 n=1 Tax=Microthlaspi erraticum TaxID=1685480 RepID=A0A6D2JS24_9BRAS|nr:unnamed protein product [Microthlaspi erraticum]